MAPWALSHCCVLCIVIGSYMSSLGSWTSSCQQMQRLGYFTLIFYFPQLHSNCSRQVRCHCHHGIWLTTEFGLPSLGPSISSYAGVGFPMSWAAQWGWVSSLLLLVSLLPLAVLPSASFSHVLYSSCSSLPSSSSSSHPFSMSPLLPPTPLLCCVIPRHPWFGFILVAGSEASARGIGRWIAKTNHNICHGLCFVIHHLPLYGPPHPPCPPDPPLSDIKLPTSLWKGEGLGLHPLLLREWKGAHIPQWRGGAHSWVDGQRWRNWGQGRGGGGKVVVEEWENEQKSTMMCWWLF